MNLLQCRHGALDLLLGIAALIAAGGLANAAMEHANVALPAENFDFLPFYVAQNAHLFERQGLDIKKVVLPGVATTNGVISGAVDFGFSNGASLTRAAAHGQKLLAIALTSDRPIWSIVMRKSVAAEANFDPKAPLAERAKALGKAHSLAIDSVNSVAHALVRVIAKIGGLNPENIPVTPLLAANALAAYERGAIDGFVANPPWTEEVLADGHTVVIANSAAGDPPWLEPFALGLVITRPQLCAEHRSICMKMGHALVAAIQFIHEHRDRSLAILHHQFPNVPPTIMASGFSVIEQSIPARPTIIEAAIRNSDRLNVEAGFMNPAQALKSYKDLFTNAFVQ